MAGSFKTDILPMFRPQDINCMKPYKVLLDSYEWMSNPDNARQVYNRLTGKETPRMPADGKYWSNDKLKKFNDWRTVDPKFQP
jgi:hypothetical protein